MRRDLQGLVRNALMRQSLRRQGLNLPHSGSGGKSMEGRHSGMLRRLVGPGTLGGGGSGGGVTLCWRSLLIQ